MVVRKGFLFTEDKVVPIDQIREATEERVMLQGEAGDLRDLPPYEETQYLPMDWEERPDAKLATAPERTTDTVIAQIAPSLFWYPTVGIQPLGYENKGGTGYVATKETNIPSDEVAIKKGARVTTDDDKEVGSVEEVITQAQTNKATHFIVSHGLIFKVHKAIPVQWVNEVTEDGVTLSVHSEMLDRLPEYQL